MRKIGFARLTPLEEALKKIEPFIKVSPLEEIKTSEALWRVLGENITSNAEVPPFDRAAMDGYALKAEDTFGASPKNPKHVRKVGTIEIGQVSNLKIERGEAIRISTGAAIPGGANTVIKIEDTKIEGDEITLYEALVPRKNVSKMGEDISKGTEILINGIDLKAAHIALLISMGFENVPVRVKPKVSVFAVGDELIEVGNPLPKNKIYNSNSTMISNLVRRYGSKVVINSTLKDDKEEIINNLLKSVKDSEIVIFTGGTSVGTKDLLPEILHESGTVLVHGIAMRPGSPVLMGIIDEKLIFCLPGTPVAAYVCFLSIVGPTLRKMLGCQKSDPRIIIPAILNKDVPVSSLGFLHFLRVKIERNKNEFNAIPVKLKGSGVISSLTESDGIVEILPSQEGLKKGEFVVVKLFP